MRFFTNPHKPMILALARPDPKKNITTLLKAFGECAPLRELANLVNPNSPPPSICLHVAVLRTEDGAMSKQFFFPQRFAPAMNSWCPFIYKSGFLWFQNHCLFHSKEELCRNNITLFLSPLADINHGQS
jgi:hypothetical protein